MFVNALNHPLASYHFLDSLRLMKSLFIFIWFQFKMKPEMHYAEKDCPVLAPGNFPKDDELHFEIELLDFAKAKAISHHELLRYSVLLCRKTLKTCNSYVVT